MYKIPILLLIRNNRLSFNYKNFVKGYHVYMKVLSLLLCECLFGKKEPNSGVDKNAVAVVHLRICDREEVVGHVPQNILKVVPLYLTLPYFYLEHEITRRHVNREDVCGLKILARFRFYGPEKATQWLATRLTKTEEQLKESINYYLKRSINLLWKNGFVVTNIRPVSYR